jgi:hypothetical protein
MHKNQLIAGKLPELEHIYKSLAQRQSYERYYIDSKFTRKTIKSS